MSDVPTLSRWKLTRGRRKKIRKTPEVAQGSASFHDKGASIV